MTGATLQLDSDAATQSAGGELAQAVRAAGIESLVVYLHGDLGAGKTTWARGFLRGLGHVGRVPSPTYTLVEPYTAGGYAVAHVDLYRLVSPDEVDALALAELTGPGTILLIEWPENGGDRLPGADLRVELAIDAAGRALRLVPLSAVGNLVALQKIY